MKEYFVQNTVYMREYLQQNNIPFEILKSESVTNPEPYLVVKRRDDAHYFWLGVGYGQFCEHKKSMPKDLKPIAP